MSRFIYGIGPVREAIKNKSTSIIFVQRQKKKGNKNRAASGAAGGIGELTQMARERKIAVVEKSRDELHRMYSGQGSLQGVLAIVGEFEYAEWEDVLARVQAAGETPLFVVLDGVQDPHNLGAIMRSAYCLGAHCVLIPERGAAPVTPTVTKVSAGATEYLPIVMVKNLARTLNDLKEAGFWNAAIASADNAIPLWELDCQMPLCIVMGGEGQGIRPLVAKGCDYAIEIPMSGIEVGSMNVSVAAGITLYEVAKKRRQPAP